MKRKITIMILCVLMVSILHNRKIVLNKGNWEYDNNGLKLIQVRFYEIGTDVSANIGDLQ